MDEQILQALSKALTHLVFRNGVVENLHADSACLDDATMKKLNIDVNNRIYTVLDIWFNGTVEEVKVGNTVKITVLPAFLGFLKFKVFEGEYLKKVQTYVLVRG